MTDDARDAALPTMKAGRGCVVTGRVVVVLLVVGLLVVLFFWWFWAPALWPDVPLDPVPEQTSPDGTMNRGHP